MVDSGHQAGDLLLAGAILARVSGASFPAVLRDSLLGPLGMDGSTFDRDEIVATTDRAIGHAAPVPNLPAFGGMTAAGGASSRSWPPGVSLAGG